MNGSSTVLDHVQRFLVLKMAAWQRRRNSKRVAIKVRSTALEEVKNKNGYTAIHIGTLCRKGSHEEWINISREINLWLWCHVSNLLLVAHARKSEIDQTGNSLIDWFLPYNSGPDSNNQCSLFPLFLWFLCPLNLFLLMNVISLFLCLSLSLSYLELALTDTFMSFTYITHFCDFISFLPLFFVCFYLIAKNSDSTLRLREETSISKCQLYPVYISYHV